MKNNSLNKYFFKEKKLANTEKKINEIEKCYLKTFYNSESQKNMEIVKKYKKFFKKKHFVSYNVILTKNIELFLRKISSEDYIFICNKDGFEYFNKLYKNYLKSKNNIFFEKIKSKKELKLIIKLVSEQKKNLICIGGGQVTDIAKFIAFKTKAKLITIPTILATHVYASPKIHALKPIKQFGYKLTIDGYPSNLSIIDLNIIQKKFKEDKRFIYSGMGDLMAFYNSKLDWFLSRKFKKDEKNFSLNSIKKVESILENIDIKKPINNWIKEYIFAQVLLCNITDWSGSAPASGTEHFFANLYEKKFPSKILHGELVALGTLIFRYLRGSNYRKIDKLMKKFKIKNSIKKFKITKSRIIQILLLCKKEGLRKKRYSILNEKKFSRLDFTYFIERMIKKKLIVLK